MKTFFFLLASVCLCALIMGQFITVHPNLLDRFERIMVAIAVICIVATVGWLVLKRPR